MPLKKLIMLITSLAWLWAGSAAAQLAPPAGFDVTGFIQEAALDGTVAGTATNPLPNTDPRAGGTLTINGLKVLVPNNSIVQLPAASFTWAQLFDPQVSAALPPGRPNHPAGQTGLALVDSGRSIPALEVRVVGNVSPDPVTGAPRYIAGLILPVSKELAKTGSGIINYINYANGWFRIGGIIGDPNSGTLVQINDPISRYGKRHSLDPRFTANASNPTITAATGFPMGIPRVAPPMIDPLCPITNRPLNGDPNFPTDPLLAIEAPLRAFMMPLPGSPAGAPDPTKQAPLMVGDWVDYQGIIFKNNPAGPNSAANMFVHAHTLVAHLGIQTQPGSNPAYVRVESFAFGVGHATTPDPGLIQDNSTQVRFVAYATDPALDGTGSAIYAVQVDPVTGAGTEALFPNGDLNDKTNLHTGIHQDDPIRGRLRLQIKTNGEAATGNAVGPGKYYREYIFRIGAGASRQMPNVANGLTAGQFRLPILDYIFPAGAVFGQPIPPFNFNDFGFLSRGSGPLNGTGPVVGPLDPWPGP